MKNKNKRPKKRTIKLNEVIDLAKKELESGTYSCKKRARPRESVLNAEKRINKKFENEKNEEIILLRFVVSKMEKKLKMLDDINKEKIKFYSEGLELEKKKEKELIQEWANIKKIKNLLEMEGKEREEQNRVATVISLDEHEEENEDIANIVNDKPKSEIRTRRKKKLDEINL